MTYTYDPTTPGGKVRMLCIDKGEPWRFTDAEISAYLSLADQNIRLAAALALEDTANNQALLEKVKKVGGIELISGVDIAKTLIGRAAILRREVEEAVFGVADWP